MKLIVLTISLAFFLGGCGLKEEKKRNDVAQEVSRNQLSLKKGSINKELLPGIWSESLDENASFWIKNDSMYFLEDQDSPAPIKVADDTLITDYGDGFLTYDKIYGLTKDSLILINEFGDTLRLVRIK